MQQCADIDLLQQYARDGSEEAFATFVQRHLNLVYSAALRKTNNASAAEEITQAVFIILAQKARNLSAQTIVSGWLYQTARLTAATHLRGESRRARREQEAYMQSLEPQPDPWPEIAPLLDDAMGGLSEKDRNALVLRFFEGKSFQDVGAAFGASENAAKKRVGHALEKLRKYFAKRGVASTAATIAGVVSANSSHAAPVGLVESVAASVAHGSTAAASTLSLAEGTMKTMKMIKLKFAAGIAAALLVSGGAATLAISEFKNDNRMTAESIARKSVAA